MSGPWQERSQIHIWEIATGQGVVCEAGTWTRPNSLAFSPDGRWLLAGSTDKLARLWDAATGKPGVVLRGHEDGVLDARFSPDGRRVVTTAGDGTARVWDPATGLPTLLLSKEKARQHGAWFSPDGGRLLTWARGDSAGNQGWVWNAETGKQLAAFGSPHSVSNVPMSWSPDGRRVLAPVPPKGNYHDGENRSLCVCDAATGKEVCRLKGHAESITCAAFGPDGRRVLTGSGDGTARLWDASSGAALGVLGGHEDYLSGVAFSPDGRRIVTVCEESVRLWEVVPPSEPGSGRPVRPLAVLAGDKKKRNFQTVLFSPDNRWLLTEAQGPGGVTVQLWPMDPQSAAVGRKPRDLTAEERELYEVP
jgi:WD40 repeat protein